MHEHQCQWRRQYIKYQRTLCITCRLFSTSLINITVVLWSGPEAMVILSTVYGVLKSIHALSSTVVTGQVHDIMQGQPHSSMYLHFRQSTGDLTFSKGHVWLFHVLTLPAATERSPTAEDPRPNEGLLDTEENCKAKQDINWALCEGHSGKLMLCQFSLPTAGYRRL
jgi:hypothetical protein